MKVRTCLAAALFCARLAEGQSVAVVAGGGAGDGGPAGSASLGRLGDLVVDPGGNVYFADLKHRSIRRVDRKSRTITTVLTLEKGDAPLFLAPGAPGKLLFTRRQLVEELDLSTGRRTVLAGNGQPLHRSGVVAEGRPATQVPLGTPSGIALGPEGDLYVGDPARAQVLRVERSTGILRRVVTLDRAFAAGGSETDDAVSHLAFDGSGRLHFSDQAHHRIFRVDGGRAVVVAGDGTQGGGIPRPGTPVEAQDDSRPATSSPLNVPGPLAFRGDDLVFGEGSGAVRRITRLGRIVTIVGPAVSWDRVTGVGFEPDGTLVVATHPATLIGQVMRMPGGSRTPEGLAGSGLPHCCGDGAPASEAELSEPEGIAVAPDGDLAIADRANHRIRRVSSRTGRISTVAGGGEFALPGSRPVLFRPVRPAPPPGRMHAMLYETLEPRFVAFDRSGSLYFAPLEGPVYRIDGSDGSLSSLGADRKNPGGPKRPDGFTGIGGIAVDAAGTVFVAAENRIWRISAAGGIGILAGTGHDGFAGDGGFALNADLSRPGWPVLDGKGALYFVDAGNSRIRKVDRSGTISTVAGTGLGFASGGGVALRESIGPARGLTLDQRGDLVYSTGDGKIWRLTLADGMLRLIAGGEQWKVQPLAVAFDGRGVLLFSEPGSSRVRAITSP